MNNPMNMYGGGTGGKPGMMMGGGARSGSPMGGTPSGTPKPGMGGLPGAAPGGTAGQAAKAEDNKGLQRTEFVILFIWKEPTDSDDLRHLTSGGSSTGGKAASPSQPGSHRPKRKSKDQAPKKS